ncbi:hypothetical protein NC652_008259 [Populus alba x Populus x berolinensis]|nr:hypothetical protein NC652_008259 [Populus alba x Populus x berolinensis]
MDFQPVASIINTLAGALYKVFYASPDEARKEIHQACFDYLSLGGGKTIEAEEAYYMVTFHNQVH